MADKSFGVKQLNLIGSTGTPTIESPGNLNLNASVVAISTDATVGRSVGIGTSATSSWAIDAIGKVRIGDGQGSILPTYGLYLTESGASNNSSVIDLLTLNSSPSGSISAGHGSGIKFTGTNTGGGASTYASIESVIEGSGVNSGGALVFKTDGINGGNTERLRINESGNIGIGTASPIAKLDVNGHTELDSVNVSGIVTAATLKGDLEPTGAFSLAGTLDLNGHRLQHDGSGLGGTIGDMSLVPLTATFGSVAGGMELGFRNAAGTTYSTHTFRGPDVNFVGIVTAAYFYGNGSNLTGIGNVLNILYIDDEGDLIHTVVEPEDTGTTDISDIDVLSQFFTSKGLTVSIGSQTTQTGNLLLTL